MIADRDFLRSLTHTVTWLTNGTAYTFEIQARNSAGWSESSGQVTATPLPPLPDAPAGLAATPGDAAGRARRPAHPEHLAQQVG